MMRRPADYSLSAITPRTRLQEARMRLRLSQSEVAGRIGTTFVNVSRWERGITSPGPYFRKRLCQFFGKEAWELDLEGEPGVTSSLPSFDRIFDPSIPTRSPRPFIGRNNLLTFVRTRLCASANGQMVCLHGLPGVGKTTLAWALAYAPHIRQYFQDGVLWVTLGPEPDLPQLLARWAAVLRIPETTLGMIRNLPEWIGTLRNAIGMRRMLLVIDDVWSQTDADVFRLGPNCAHLVTTRFCGVAATVATPPESPIHVGELGTDEGLALLQRMAPAAARVCAASSLKTFVRSVGGLPLALKQAGSYLRKTGDTAGSKGLPAALQRLSDPTILLRLNELSEMGGWYPGIVPELSSTLETAVASICQVLPEPARAALAALAFLPPKPHTFSESEALTVAHCSPEALDELLDAGLLEPYRQGGYAIHAVIATYARAFLPQDR